MEEIRTLTVYDEVPYATGLSGHTFILQVAEEQMTVRDLIRTRVYQEAEEYNQRQSGPFFGLVQPVDAEMKLNGFRLPRSRRIDPEAQYVRALEAFQSNGFILLVNDHQVENLDDIISINPTTTATFLRLIPLVGG